MICNSLAFFARAAEIEVPTSSDLGFKQRSFLTICRRDTRKRRDCGLDGTYVTHLMPLVPFVLQSLRIPVTIQLRGHRSSAVFPRMHFRSVRSTIEIVSDVAKLITNEEEWINSLWRPSHVATSAHCPAFHLSMVLRVVTLHQVLLTGLQDS